MTKAKEYKLIVVCCKCGVKFEASPISKITYDRYKEKETGSFICDSCFNKEKNNLMRMRGKNGKDAN